MAESVDFSLTFDPSTQTQSTDSIAIGGGEVLRVDFDQAPSHFVAYLIVNSGGNEIRHDLDSDLRSFNIDIATDGDIAKLFLRAYRGVIEGTFESVASAEGGGPSSSSPDWIKEECFNEPIAAINLNNFSFLDEINPAQLATLPTGPHMRWASPSAAVLDTLQIARLGAAISTCLLYTSDAADE